MTIEGLTPVQQQLSAGNRSIVSLCKEVAKQVLAQPHLITEVVDSLGSEISGVPSRAARVVELVCLESPDLVRPFKREILDSYAWIDEWQVRAHLSKVIPFLELNRKDVDLAYQIFDRYLSDRSSVVRTFAMQGMFDLLDRAPERTDSVRELIEELTGSGTPAMLARGRMLLVALEKM